MKSSENIISSRESDLRVIDVENIGNLQLLIEFSNGEKKIFDFKQLLEIPVYEKLQNKEIFEDVSIKNGILTWDDENIDVSTDYLYKNSKIN